MEKWLKNKALGVLLEYSNSTNGEGLDSLEKYAKYAGSKNAEDLLYSILKNVADHVQYCNDNPEIAEQINDIPFKLR
tara:strand:- start:6 stop:236 length:231 start_codon:yes stop_codon:yes gene_type:complete